MLTAETKERLVSMFGEWNEVMLRRGLQVNTDKTKLLACGKTLVTRRETGKHLCGACSSVVALNSILCIQCNKWAHGLCSGEQRLTSVAGFRCSTCLQLSINVSNESIMVEYGTVEEVERF